MADRSIKELIDIGWTSACEGTMALSTYAIEWYRGRGKYKTLSLRVQGGRHVEVSVSPTGRSVRIFVDGIEVPPRS